MTVSVSSSPPRSDAATLGCFFWSARARFVAQTFRRLHLQILVYFTHPRTDVGVPLVGQMPEHIAELVDLAALHQRSD